MGLRVCRRKKVTVLNGANLRPLSDDSDGPHISFHAVGWSLIGSFLGAVFSLAVLRVSGVSESAGINRLGNENERVLRRTTSH